MGDRNTGYTEPGFARRAELERDRTKYYKERVENITLWSFIGEEQKGAEVRLRFYKLTRETIREQREGVAAPLVVNKKLTISNMEKALLTAAVRGLTKNGLLISGINKNDPSRMYGLTDAGLISICDKLRIYGDFARTPSPFRDFLIAEKLLMSARAGTEYVFAAKEADGRSNMVTGVFEDRYTGNGFWGMYETYAAIRDVSARFEEKLSMREWSITENEMYVHAEYNDLKLEIDKGKALIPGIRLMNSDSGRRSFTMQSVIRPSGTDDIIIINERKLKHCSSRHPREACSEWVDDAVNELRDWLQDIDVICGKIGPAGGDTLQQLRNAVNISGIGKIIGKKREKIWVQKIRSRLKEGGAEIYKNRAWWLLTIHNDLREEKNGLGETESEKLSRALGKIYETA